MTPKEAFAILSIPQDSSLEAIKQAYRRLAFSLHPDLNPGLSNAGKKFQRLNEAYVFLSQEYKAAEHQSASASQSEGTSAKARQEARRAYQKASAQQKKSGSSTQADANSTQGNSQEEVLREILNDPFAKRVFEDIYQTREEKQRASFRETPSFSNTAGSPAYKTVSKGKNYVATGRPAQNREQPGKFTKKIKSWLLKQIDEEQVLELPGGSLVPGARVRLQIQHGLAGETQTVEITLPPDFTPGKVIRLRGLGRRLGSWSGDLYVRIQAR